MRAVSTADKASDLALPSTDQMNTMFDEVFSSTGNTRAGTRPDYALTRRLVVQSLLRLSGFVFGPTQFGLADAAPWNMVFTATGRIEPTMMASELSACFQRPTQGETLWARATAESAGRRSVATTTRVWHDDPEYTPSSTAQSTYSMLF